MEATALLMTRSKALARLFIHPYEGAVEPAKAYMLSQKSLRSPTLLVGNKPAVSSAKQTDGGACRLDPAATRTILSLPSTLSPSPSRDVGLEPLVAGQRPMTSS